MNECINIGVVLRNFVDPGVILFILYVLVALSGLNASGAFQLSMPVGVIALILFGSWVAGIVIYYLTLRFLVSRFSASSPGDVPTAPLRTDSEERARRNREEGQ